MLFCGLQRPHRDFNPLGMWGCILGLLEASMQTTTFPARKKERRGDRTTLYSNW